MQGLQHTLQFPGVNQDSRVSPASLQLSTHVESLPMQLYPVAYTNSSHDRKAHQFQGKKYHSLCHMCQNKYLPFVWTENAILCCWN